MAYLLIIKKCVDTLVTIGATLCNEDHEAILDRLPKNYDSFVTSILSHLDPYIVEEVKALLLSQKQRFTKHRYAIHTSVHLIFGDSY